MALRTALNSARQSMSPISNLRLFSIGQVYNANIRKSFADSNVDPNWEKMAKCKANQDCPPRMDDMVQPAKNHSKPYQKNWCDPGATPKLPKYEAKDCPQAEAKRRPKKPVKATNACGSVAPPDDSCGKPHKKKEVKCLKITSLYCPAVRVPTKCVKHRVQPECKRILAPLPSFHECIRDPIPPLPPTECHCLEKRNVCPGPLADR